MLVALLGAVFAHKIEEDDVIENVDIRKVDVRREFGDFVKVCNSRNVLVIVT